MRYLIIFIIIFYFVQNSSGQTYIGPVIGYDFAKIQSSYQEIDDKYFYTTRTGFVNQSPVFGIKLEQYLFPFLYFSLQSTFTHKFVEAETTGIIPVVGIKFNNFQQYISLKLLIANSIYFGGGINFSFINSINQDHGSHIKPSTHTYSDTDKGFRFSSGIKIKNVDFEIYYYKSANVSFQDVIFSLYKIDGIATFGLNVSYNLKVFDRINLFKKKGQDCPKF